jgi:hypothetical protein
MRTATILVGGLLAAVGILDAGTGAADSPDPPAWAPKFKVQEIDTGLKIGYAVLVADLNGDNKPDLVVVDQHKVVWYENPTWKKRVILDGKTKPDNVCITALDIDGDGKLDLVLGAGWRPTDTANPGTLQWLKNPGVVDKEWAMYPIPCDEPTVHRIRAIDIDGDGRPEVVSVPLQGRDCTAKGNWTDGRPVRITSYKVPAKDPEKPESWKPVVLSEELHVCHNFWPRYPGTELGTPSIAELYVASYEGVSVVHRSNGTWTTTREGEGNQTNQKGSRGASEIKYLKWGRTGDPVIATIEPWHGNQVVTYTPPKPGAKLWNRHVIDEQLRWGHAVWFADLDGDGKDELIIGVRDDPNPKAGDKFTERRGVRIYKCTGGKGEKWERFILDNGGVAVEDLAAADLDGDGKIDIIAVGRQTGNCRIYWNQGK